MQSSDRLEIISNIREQGVDDTKQLLAPLVSRVEKYAKDKRLEPSDERVVGAISQFVQEGNGKFKAILNNGGSIPISQQTYLSEATYNFLPLRYKTLKP